MTITDELLKEDQESTLERINNEVHIPAKCLECKISTVCRVYPYFIELSDIGIVVSVEKCIYEDRESKKIKI